MLSFLLVSLTSAATGQAGADVSLIQSFSDALAAGETPEAALRSIGAPAVVQHFVGTTLDIACNGSTTEVCAAFSIGRDVPSRICSK
jgi:hypothetical protein